MRRDFVDAVVRLVCCGLNERARIRYQNHHAGIERMRTYLGMLDCQPLIEVWQTLSPVDFRSLLPAIPLPALLVYGSDSNYYPPATGPWVRDALSDARLCVYEKTDHSPHVALPERFAADLAAFAAAP